MKKIISIVILTSLVSFAQNENDSWNFSGQVQIRSEVDGRDFRNITHPYFFTSMRTRVGVQKSLLDKLNFFVQFQDSRVFGEEANTLGSIKNIDLHQGYIELVNPFELPVSIQGGRFEVIYGTERFFGAVSWHYIGRAWDGVRFKFNPGFKIDLFALTHSETVSYIGNATPGLYPYPAQSKPSYSVYGLWESMNLTDQHQLDLFGYYEINREKSDGRTDYMLDRYTIGFNHFGSYGIFSSVAEGAYQFGKINSFDVSAYLVSLQSSIKIENIKLTAGADIISGSDKSFGSGELNYFSPTFGTNHKFYGYMDYFINIPSNTFGTGLNDFYLSSSISTEDSKFIASLDIHHFVSNTGIFVTSEQGPDGKEETTFGQGIDLTLKYNFIKGTTITWSGSVFIPGELMRTMFTQGDDVAFWSYVMITANI